MVITKQQQKTQQPRKLYAQSAFGGSFKNTQEII